MEHASLPMDLGSETQAHPLFMSLLSRLALQGGWPRRVTERWWKALVTILGKRVGLWVTKKEQKHLLCSFVELRDRVTLIQ